VDGLQPSLTSGVSQERKMKKISFCLLLAVFLASSCATHGPFYVGIPYGAAVPYGEGRHPGIDFDISIGTPIIACSDGEIIYIGEPDAKERDGGGIFVEISHVRWRDVA